MSLLTLTKLAISKTRAQWKSSACQMLQTATTPIWNKVGKKHIFHLVTQYYSPHLSQALLDHSGPQNSYIPGFPYDVEMQLQNANQAFISTGALLNSSHKLKSDILESLADQIMKFKAYPSNLEIESVAEFNQSTSMFERKRIFQWFLRMENKP